MADWHLHELYRFLPDLGIDVIHATHHRFVVDLNRPPDSQPLYPGRFETGLIATKTFQGETIWRDPPGAAEIEARRERYHKPYHEALERRLREKVARFGRCVLIDAHSVESRANLLHGALEEDIYLGDRDGKTCEPWLIEFVGKAFAWNAIGVSFNDPYKGGYITAHYPSIEGVQTLQIEMCQRLYMSEGRPQGAPDQLLFRKCQVTLRSVFGDLVAEIQKKLAAG
jgi:N-formylglutamate amidohydrolase